MALNYDSVSALTKDNFVDMLIDNIFTSLLLFQRFKSNKTYISKTGGKKIVQPLIYANIGTNCAWYASGDTLTINTTEEFTAADFNWKYIHASLTIPRDQELQNAGMDQVI